MNDTKITTGGPAFPSLESEYDGMSLRDYFAAAACTGMLLAKNNEALQVHVDIVAKASYGVADAMLKARAK